MQFLGLVQLRQFRFRSGRETGLGSLMVSAASHLRDRRAFRRAARDTIDLPRAKSAMVPMVLDLMG